MLQKTDLPITFMFFASHDLSETDIPDVPKVMRSLFKYKRIITGLFPCLFTKSLLK